MSKTLDLKITRLTEVIKHVDSFQRLMDNHPLEVDIPIDESDLLLITQVLEHYREMYMKRRAFYAEAQRRRDQLRVRYGPPGKGQDAAMVRLGITLRSQT